MKSVGEQLKQARIEQNLNLEEVYRQTKVHPHVLEALEQDRAHNFLNFVYIKGFLKKYAQFLGLDAGKLIKEYVETEGRRGEFKPEKPKPEPKTAEKKKPGLKQVNVFLVARAVFSVLLFVALIVYFRYVVGVISHAQDRKQTPQVKVKVRPLSGEVEQRDLDLRVRAKEDCWLKVEADGQVVFERTLTKAKVESWRTKEKFELRIGKPEALEITLNGEAVDLRQVKVKKGLEITSKGIVGK